MKAKDIVPIASRPREAIVIGLVCAATLSIYAAIGLGQRSEFGDGPASNAYYNLLARGLWAGQLHLPLEAPSGLIALPDPLDPASNAPFRGNMYTASVRLHDLSFFEGKLYLYFGPTPALLLFGPFSLLTGAHLSHAVAAVILSGAAFLAGSLLLASIRRAWFPDASLTAFAAGVLALGLGNGAALVLSRAEVWEVAVLCGHLMVTLSLVALWGALRAPGQAVFRLGAASLLLGLALGARPSLLPGAVILLLPLAQDEASGRRGKLLAAAVVPVATIGILLLAYNHFRFGSPLEFGQRYQLAGDRQDRAHFGLEHLPFNLWAYLAAPASWGDGFPWVSWARFPQPPNGHGNVDPVFGTITNFPFNWLLGGLPFTLIALRGAAVPARLFLAAPLIMATIGMLLLGCFYGTCIRYQMEFTPWIVLLAAIIGLSADARLAKATSIPRQAVEAAVILAAIASAGFSILAVLKLRGMQVAHESAAHAAAGNLERAAALLEEAIRLDHSEAAYHEELALLLSRKGSPEDAVLNHFRRALRIDPRRISAHNNLGLFLAGKPGGRMEAISHLRTALQLRPDHPVIHFNLGLQLQELPSERAMALVHFRTALELNPGFRPAKEALAKIEASTVDHAQAPARP